MTKKDELGGCECISCLYDTEKEILTNALKVHMEDLKKDPKRFYPIHPKTAQLEIEIIESKIKDIENTPECKNKIYG